MNMPSDDEQFQRFYRKLELTLWTLILLGVAGLLAIVSSLLL